MEGDGLKNWLAALGIGGVALGGVHTPAEAAQHPVDRLDGGRSRLAEERQPLYVVINHEEQYSIWPAREKPPGEWRVITDELDLQSAVKRAPGEGHLRFRVVINHEEQYSIWPADRRPPEGFRAPSPRLERETCEILACAKLVERQRGRPF